MAGSVAPFFAFGPFIFCCLCKLLLHNSASVTASAIGDGLAGPAHTVIMSVAMFCFVLGDVGSSLAQAFLPTYCKKRAVDVDGGYCEIADDGSGPSFDLEKARPAIKAVLRVSVSISAVCVAVSSAILTMGAGAFTSDAAVATTLRNALPFTAATLSMHASAVTLEGLLLVQRRLGFLCRVYAVMALGIVLANRTVMQRGLGLNGVWAVYVVFQFVRITAFSWRAGLLQGRGQEEE